MPVTIRDVARSLNLSHTTVSRALNGREAINIPAATRERVRVTANQMGYTPNRAARALATGRTHLIALQTYRLSSPYAWMVSQQMQEILGADGYEVLVREFGRGDLTLQSSVDGIFALDSRHLPSENSLPPAVPYVLLGTRPSPAPPLDFVGLDLGEGARLATEHLIKAGRRRIVHLTSADLAVEDDARCRGYEAALRSAGLAAEYIKTPADLRRQGYDALLAFAARQDVPDALLCRNDELAAGCLRALHELGRSVPGDTAVIGCDGTDEGEYLSPPLSTIAVPVAEMCRLAWRFLRRRIEEPDCPVQEAVLLPSLLLRQSA